MNPIRVFLVDDHDIFRRGLHAVIQAHGLFTCVGEAADGADALHRAPPLQPDLVVMDLAMPGLDAMATLRALRASLPHTRFVLTTWELDPQELRQGEDLGGCCVLHKSATPEELITVLHAAHRGQALVSPQMARCPGTRSPAHHVGADLTQRERKLLSLMACGLGNREISAQLSIALPTVKFHVTNILSKLHAENRTSAVLAAIRHKLVTLD